MLSFVSDEITLYCEKHSTLPSDVCAALEKYTLQTESRSIMLTGPLVGSFLGFLVQQVEAKRILEIGTYTGYSALVMAERLPQDGQLVTLDIDPQTTQIAKMFWERSPHGKKIHPLLGPALNSLSQLKPGFDLVFIDADKPNYLAYLNESLSLLSPNGLIVVDNCLWSGRVLDSSVSDPDTIAIREFNAYVAKNPALVSTLVPLRDGLHLIRMA